LGRFVLETLHKRPQNLAGVVDLLRVLSHNPDQRTPCVGLIDLVNVLAQLRNDSLISRILPEDVLPVISLLCIAETPHTTYLDHHDSLLHYIVDLSVNKV
jgi:hypothetical protein